MLYLFFNNHLANLGNGLEFGLTKLFNKVPRKNDKNCLDCYLVRFYLSLLPLPNLSRISSENNNFSNFSLK